jgi:hypothetical protein
MLLTTRVTTKEITKRDEMLCTGRLYYLATSTTFHLVSRDNRWHSIHRHLNLLCQCPHILVQCIAVTIMFLVTIFKEGAGNSFLYFNDESHPTNPLFILCQSSAGDIENIIF